MIPPALAVTGNVWTSLGLGVTGDRIELEGPELGGLVEDSSSAETWLLDGFV